MSSQIVEYLYYFRKESCEDIEKIFREIILFYEKENFLYYESKGKKLKFRFDIIPYNNSLHVTFKYNKSGRIGMKEVCLFKNFLNELNIKTSKANLDHTTLLDTNSLFFSKKLLPYLHSYEWSLRKLIYLVSPSYFSENWIENTFSKEKISLMKKKEKGDFDKKNLLQLMDLFDFEEYLFGKNYIKIIGEENNTVRFKEMSAEELVNLFQVKMLRMSEPYSLWEEIFSEYINIELEEIQTDMKLIREGRNIVGHNKELTETVYQNLVKKLKLYIRQLEEAFQKILSGNVNDEELSNMADDIEGYIGNKLNRMDLIGVKFANENLARSMSTMQGMDTSAMKQTIGNLGSAMSVLKEMDLTGVKLANKNLARSMSTMQGMDTSAMKQTIGNLGSAMSVLKEMDLTGVKLANKNLARSMSTMQGMDTSAMKQTIGNLGSAMSVLKEMDLTGVKLANKNLARSMSTMQGMDTSAMQQTIGNLGSAMSVLKGMDLTGVKLANKNLARSMSTMQGMDTSAMQQTIGNLGSAMSVLKGMDLTGVKLANKNLARSMSTMQGMDTSAMQQTIGKLVNTVPAQEKITKDTEVKNDG
ncbi:hypothetical protein ABQE01_02250 [Enterococcus thailandicus]|uniref:hypothetical protein n=1 Tax=Enterococcus thailandicus TaxID=417368 RepID=UPI0032E4E0C8